MNDFRLIYDWESGDGVGTPELAATWARLEIWAGDDCVTRVEDQASKSARRAIYCSLYPLAEWAAYNWWLLKAHARLAGGLWRPSQLWNEHAGRSNHNIRTAGDGFVWPNAAIIPEGFTTRVVWARDREPAPGAPIRFISEGLVICDPASVELALATLIENVLARLEEVGITTSALADEWQAVMGADPDEAAFCVAAARLGLDPYSLEDSFARMIATIGSELDSYLLGDLLGDFLDAVDPRRVPAGVQWMAKSAKRLREIDAEPHALVGQIRSAVNASQRSSNGGTKFKPWQLGWDQARLARSAVGIDAVTVFEVDDLVTLAVEPTFDPGLVAVGGATQSGGHALLAAQELSDNARRFATARALWHVAVAPERRFLLTAAHTDRQKVERAFAAELLAPARGVQAMIHDDDGIVYFEQVEAVAEHFGVASRVIEHQVENQLELSIAE